MSRNVVLREEPTEGPYEYYRARNGGRSPPAHVANQIPVTRDDDNGRNCYINQYVQLEQQSVNNPTSQNQHNMTMPSFPISHEHVRSERRRRTRQDISFDGDQTFSEYGMNQRQQGFQPSHETLNRSFGVRRNYDYDGRHPYFPNDSPYHQDQHNNQRRRNQQRLREQRGTTPTFRIESQQLSRQTSSNRPVHIHFHFHENRSDHITRPRNNSQRSNRFN